MEEWHKAVLSREQFSMIFGMNHLVACKGETLRGAPNMKPSGLRQPHEGHSGITILFRRLIFIVVMSCFVCHVAQATSPGMLNGNLQVVDLSDLVEPLPLGVNSSTKILHQTQNWEHSSLGNPSWPAGGHAS